VKEYAKFTKSVIERKKLYDNPIRFIEVRSYSRYSTQRLIGAHGHALLVVRGGLIVGVDDGVGGHAVGVVGLGPGVDGVDVIEHGEGENGEHFNCASKHSLATTRLPYQRPTRHTCWSAQPRTRGKAGSRQKLQKAPGATTHTTRGECLARACMLSARAGAVQHALPSTCRRSCTNHSLNHGAWRIASAADRVWRRAGTVAAHTRLCVCLGSCGRRAQAPQISHPGGCEFGHTER